MLCELRVVVRCLMCVVCCLVLFGVCVVVVVMWRVACFALCGMCCVNRVVCWCLYAVRGLVFVVWCVCVC